MVNNILNVRTLYAKYICDLRFKRYIEFLRNEFIKQNVQVIYHSETGFCEVDGFKNIITIYDLTTCLFPAFHRGETVDLQKRKLKFAKKHSDGIVCISHTTKKDLLKIPDFISKRNVAIIYPGLDESFENHQKGKQSKVTFSDINLILKYHKNKIVKKKYLLYYGTFEPRKNLVYLVKAFADLQEQNKIPDDYKLVLLGGEGWGHVKNAIRNFVLENFPVHKKNNIIILGYLSDDYIAELIKGASAVVYPSIYEGFGLPVLESLALGTPVICSHTSSLPEVGGDSVLYVDPNDFFDLKEKMQRFINSSSLPVKLSQKGLRQSKKFDWERSGNQLYTFLNHLIQKT